MMATVGFVAFAFSWILNRDCFFHDLFGEDLQRIYSLILNIM